ncbi:MAG: porin family protein [Ginsengibacter sp.]
MFKQFLIAWILITLSFTGMGQKNTIEYGFHGGLNVNSSHGSSSLNKKAGSTLGYHLGSHVKVKMTNHFGVKAILQYEQLGWAYRSLYFENNTGTGFSKGDVTYHLNYLNLPLLAEYEFGNKIKFNGQAGIFVGALLKNQYITTIQDRSPSKIKSDNWKLLNYGISVGIGSQITLTQKMKLNIDLRNSLGLCNLYKSSNSAQGTQKTNSLLISSGLSFLL